MSAGLALNEGYGSLTPSGPLISIPSTLEERIAATARATYADDRYFMIQGAQKERAQRMLDDYHTLTGERLRNPYDLVPTTGELFDKDGVAQPIPTIMANRLATMRDKMAKAREQFRDFVGQQPPDFLNPDMIAPEIAQRGQTARREEAERVGTGNGIGNFFGGMALETATPHGVASLFAPVTRLPLAAAARTVDGFAGSVGREALLQAGVASGTQAFAEGLDYLTQKPLGTQRTGSEIVSNILTAGAGGAILGGAVRGLHLAFLPEAPLAVRDAAHVVGYAEAFDGSNRLGVEPALHERLTDQAQGDVLRGRVPNLSALLSGADTPMTALGTILRETPDQIAVRLPGIVERIKALPDSEIEAVARELRPNSFKALDAVEQKLKALDERTAGLQREAEQIGAADVIDMDTAAILHDIDQRLQQKGLRRAAREQLEHEQRQWLQTLDVHGGLTAELEKMRAELFPEHGPALKEIAAEREGLMRERELTRQEAQREVDFLRSKLESLKVEKPEDVAKGLGAEPGIDVDKALRTAEFNRQVRTAALPPEAILAADRHPPATPFTESLRAEPERAKALGAEVDRVLARGGETVKPKEELKPETEGFKGLRDAAIRFYRERLIGQEVVNEATGRVIKFDRTGSQKSTSRVGPDLLRLVPALPDLLRTARPLGLPEIDRAARAGIVRWHQFLATAELDGKSMGVVLTVREMKDGTFHYALNKQRESAAGGRGFPSPEGTAKEGLNSQRGLTESDVATGGDLNIATAGEAGKAVPEHLREIAGELDRAERQIKDAQAAAGCVMGGLL